MKIFGVLATFVFTEVLNLITAYDPCKNYEMLHNSKYRGTGCPSIAGRDLCDKYITPQWYRVEGDAELVTEEVELFSCATTYPVWMPEALPTNGLEINATVCINKGYAGKCRDELMIKVKDCSSYYVYYLQPPDACPISYCFGLNTTCPPFEPCDKHYHDVLKYLDARSFCGDKKPGWYSIPKKTKIQTKCPQSSGNAVWINGSSIVPGEVFDAKVCFKDSDSCCENYADVQIKNCSGSLVFNISGEANCFFSDSSIWTFLHNESITVSSTVHYTWLWSALFIQGLFRMFF